MNNSLSIIILGAGRGTRMKSNISKLLHKVGNLEIINHVIKTSKRLDAEDIVVVVSEDNKSQIDNNVDSNIKTVIQYERKGTADATKIGLQKISNKNNNMLVLYGDIPLIKEETYRKMIDKLDDNFAISVLGFYTADINNKYGRLVLNDANELEKIIEYKDATDEERKNTLCNAVLAIKGELLERFLDEVGNDNAAKEFYLVDVIKIARKHGYRITYSLADESEVIGVNSRDQLSMAERIFQDNRRREFMENGATLIDPNSVYFSYDTEIGRDVVIEPNVVFLPNVKIHDNVTIKSFSYLEECEVKSGAVIGPFARIRPETVINEDAKIGNFCEIKKSNIGKGTKVNHLSYIGDTEIDENTNIGAGTITCNYDGYSKFNTKIGKDSFIGSNTTIVAPVEIGDNVLTGAGSVITKNIKDNELSIARAEQKNLADGMIKYRKKRSK
jgi:bifunctional UDP-N-acetylglucosamine pyrophosphorylase/glucosamine-1-phosphate N-acetyltransferase